MNILKTYLLGRTTSYPAWIGFIVLCMELVLHLGNTSTLMIVFALLLIVTPQERIEQQFRDWTKKLTDSVK